MSTTNPIRNRKTLGNFKNYYVNIRPHPSNYVLFGMGLKSGFRISDLLKLQWQHVWDDHLQHFRTHICLEEHKTGKTRIVPINPAEKKALTTYRNVCTEKGPSDYLFPSTRDKTKPLSRYQAYRIIKAAAEACGLEEHVSCHSLRKTFGYHAWKQGTPPAMLMELYNHSSYGITKRYLGIEQDEKDNVYMKIEL